MNDFSTIHGIIPPILTPMNSDESINENELRNEIERMIQCGVHGIFSMGTNGEAYILSDSEKEFVLEVTVDAVNHRVPVYAGTGCVGTRQTIEASKKAQRIGADILSVITPWFAAASQEELCLHYREIAAEVDLPIVLYNIPARTGNNIAPATVAKLARECENIVGIKDSSGNFDCLKQYVEVTRECGKPFYVLSGNDSLILPILMFGGVGGVAGCANVYPNMMVSIYNELQNGNIERAKAYQDSIRSFRNCYRFGNPNTIVKTAAAMLGFPVGPCRAPFDQISTECRMALEKVIAENKEKGIS